MAEIVSEIILKANSTEAVSSIKDLRNNVREYKNQLTQLESGTEEYNRVLNQLAESQGALNQINRETQAVTQNLTQIYSNVSRVSAGVVAGFTSLTSISALLGKENENLAQALVKVQAGLQLTQAIYAVSNGFNSLNKLIIGFPQIINKVRTAFMALNATLLSSPLFILAATVGAIIVAFQAFGDGLDSSTSKTKKLNDEIRSLNSLVEILNGRLISGNIRLEDSLDRVQKWYVNEKEILADNNASKEEYLKLDIERAKRRSGIIKSEAERELELINQRFKAATDADAKIKKRTEDDDKAFRKLREDYARDILRIDRDIFNAENALVDARRALITNQQAAEKAANTARLAADKQTKQKLEAAQKKYNESTIKLETDRANRILDVQRDLARDSNYIDIINSQLDDNAQKQQVLIDRITELGNITKKTAKDYEELVKAQNNLNTLEQRQVSLAKELETARKEYEKDTKSINLLLKEQNAIVEDGTIAREFYNAQGATQIQAEIDQYEREQERNKERLLQLESDLSVETITNERRIELLNEYNSALNNQFSLERSIAQSRKKLSDEDLKVKLGNLNATAGFLNAAGGLLSSNTAAAKALGVASATISTYTGAAQVLANPLDWNAFTKWANFATTIAIGLGAVKNILATNVPGASGSSSSSISTPSLPSFPEMDTNFYEVHNTMDGYEVDELNQQRTVLVLEDFNQINNRVRVAEDSAKF